MGGRKKKGLGPDECHLEGTVELWKTKMKLQKQLFEEKTW